MKMFNIWKTGQQIIKTSVVETEETNAPMKTIQSPKDLVLLPRRMEKFPMKKIWTLFYSMPHKIEAIIWAKGSNTNYELHTCTFFTNKDHFVKKQMKSFFNLRAEKWNIWWWPSIFAWPFFNIIILKGIKNIKQTGLVADFHICFNKSLLGYIYYSHTHTQWSSTFIWLWLEYILGNMYQ